MKKIHVVSTSGFGGALADALKQCAPDDIVLQVHSTEPIAFIDHRTAVIGRAMVEYAQEVTK